MDSQTLDTQTIIVAAIGVAMAFFLVRYIVRIVRAKETPKCGCGCHSAPRKEETQEQR